MSGRLFNIMIRVVSECVPIVGLYRLTSKLNMLESTAVLSMLHRSESGVPKFRERKLNMSNTNYLRLQE